MKNKKHPIITMAYGVFHTWVCSPRVVIMVLFLIAISYIQLCGFKITLQQLPYSMGWAESCYYILGTGVGLPMSSILYLVMLNDLPLYSGFQNMFLIRSNRRSWILSQVLYAAWASFFMVCIRLVMTLITIRACTENTGGWSETGAILAGFTTADEALVSSFVRTALQPFAAILLSCVVLFLFWFTMTMVILLFSILGKAILGELIYVFLLMANIIIYVEFIPWITIPLKYGVFQSLLGTQHEWSHYALTIIGYLIINSLLCMLMILRINKLDLQCK